MGTFRCKILLTLLSAGTLPAQPRYPVDRKSVGSEAVVRFTELLRIDTSNPPGNETVAATWLKQVLEKEGIECKLFALEPDRANLVARLKGNGSKRPLLVMGHTDVVGVQKEKWSFDPFTPTRKNGFLYARGAVDDKDNATAGGPALERDRRGIRAGRGSATVARNGKVRYVGISATEKIPRPVRLVARGRAGHGSRPTNDNVVLRLASAVAKVGQWQAPMRLNDISRVFRASGHHQHAGGSPALLAETSIPKLVEFLWYAALEVAAMP